MVKYRNHYECPDCKAEWHGDSDRIRNDPCPKCDTETTPHATTELDSGEADDVCPACGQRALSQSHDFGANMQLYFCVACGSMAIMYRQGLLDNEFDEFDEFLTPASLTLPREIPFPSKYKLPREYKDECWCGGKTATTGATRDDKLVVRCAKCGNTATR